MFRLFVAVTTPLAILPGLALAQETSQPAAADPPPISEPTAPPPSAPAPPQEVAPAPGPEAVAVSPVPPIEDTTPPDRLSVGKSGGYFEPGALIQTWFYLGDPGATFTTFRIRRAELSAKGEIVPDLVSYKLMIDPAKLLKFREATVEITDEEGDVIGEGTGLGAPDDTSILQDVVITYQSEYADVSIGQFKTPLSYEGYNSSSKLLFPERAIGSKEFGDRRDLGIKVEKGFDRFRYVVGLFNGGGINQLDSNNQKDLALRLEVLPIDAVMLGAVGYTSIGDRSQPTSKDRLEGDLRVEAENAILQAEYIHAWTGPKGARVEGHSVYGVLGYRFFERLQPLVRIGMLDRDLDADDDQIVHYEFGANYYLRQHELKFQTSLGFFNPAGTGATTVKEFIFSAQAAF